jgi:hypothetical protein
MTRCPNGTRRNKKTGNCEKHNKATKRSPNGTRKTQKPANWIIHEIHYVYPTITDSVSKDQRGFMNIESIFLLNDNKSVAQIILEGGKVEIVIDDNNATMKDLKKIGRSDISAIRFFGTENDEDGNYTTKENIDEIKSGVYGKLIKIEVSGKGIYTLDHLNDSDQKQVLAKTIKLLKNIK